MIQQNGAGRSLAGKTILITGATNGIGRVSAGQLAKMGATVIVVGRSAERLSETVREIEAMGGRVEAERADLASMAQTRELAARVTARHERIHVLLNNAGATFTQKQITDEGLEMTFALNHMSFFLLTHLLLDSIRAAADQSGEARIINVSSSAHFMGTLDFGNLQSERNFAGFGTYSTSKLMNVLFTYALARRLAGTNITVNALHPGLVDSGFFQGNGIMLIAMRLMKPFMKLTHIMVTPEQGAYNNIFLASSPTVKGLTGGYYSDGKLTRSAPVSYDTNVQEHLWAATETLAGVTTAVPIASA